MTFDLIVTRGRVGDRNAMTAVGTANTARALKEHFDLRAVSVGEPSAPAQDGWKESLAEAGETLASLQEQVAATLRDGRRPVIVSNTCSASLASLPVFAAAYPEATLCWIDAHGDFNTPETTKTGYIGGMVLSTVCGLWTSGYGSGLDSRNVVLIAARDIDDEEHALLDQAGVRIIEPADVTLEKVAEVVGSRPVWIHIDWDALEPGVVPADYSVGGGMSLEEIEAVVSVLARNSVVGLELAEYTPLGVHPDDPVLSTIVQIVRPILGSS